MGAEPARFKEVRVWREGRGEDGHPVGRGNPEKVVTVQRGR